MKSLTFTKQMEVPYKNKSRYGVPAESDFLTHAELQGWTVTKRGWPDFIVFDKNGDFLFCVEVKRTKSERYGLLNVNTDIKRKKRKTQHLPFQRRVIQLLDNSGLKTRVWTPKDGFGEESV
jgi:hypothetical protein